MIVLKKILSMAKGGDNKTWYSY